VYGSDTTLCTHYSLAKDRLQINLVKLLFTFQNLNSFYNSCKILR